MGTLSTLLLAVHFLALGFIGGRLPGHWTTASSQPSWLWRGFSIIEFQPAFIRILIIFWFKVITMVNIGPTFISPYCHSATQSNYLPSPMRWAPIHVMTAVWLFVNLQSLQKNILNVQFFSGDNDIERQWLLSLLILILQQIFRKQYLSVDIDINIVILKGNISPSILILQQNMSPLILILQQNISLWILMDQLPVASHRWHGAALMLLTNYNQPSLLRSTQQ